jgi:hypothetical protein
MIKQQRNAAVFLLLGYFMYRSKKQPNHKEKVQKSANFFLEGRLFQYFDKTAAKCCCFLLEYETFERCLGYKQQTSKLTVSFALQKICRKPSRRRNIQLIFIYNCKEGMIYLLLRIWTRK